MIWLSRSSRIKERICLSARITGSPLSSGGITGFITVTMSKRDGIPLDRISDIGMILQAEDWADQASAPTAFDEIVARGTQLSERML